MLQISLAALRKKKRKRVLSLTAIYISWQMITRGPNDSLDLIRTMRMASYGMLISGPSLHLWFNFVSKVLPKRDVVTTFMKMFLGQTVYGPIVTSVFFSYNAALQGTIAFLCFLLNRLKSSYFLDVFKYMPLKSSFQKCPLNFNSYMYALILINEVCSNAKPAFHHEIYHSPTLGFFISFEMLYENLDFTEV